MSGLGSGMLMPCRRMHRANATAACWLSLLPPGLVVALSPRLATPLDRPPPPQAATASARASAPTSTASHGPSGVVVGVAGLPGCRDQPWGTPLVGAERL
jgi:hypothetical protein